ncbi:YkoP family protein [Acidicapsa ligni]|uniref:YkoP family protein n=1 Tax=Acidicapsa ligni TaxID=542300 RepID=UPI0021E0796F|nr:hypothetical protein [Acidicapsa ligni]
MSSQLKQSPSSIPLQPELTQRRFTIPEPLSRYGREAVVLGVRIIDFLLRFCTGIREFSKRSDCILRVSVSRCPSEVVLPDARVITQGARLLELHFWNEHLIHCLGPHELFGWGFCLQRRIRFSLMLLADWAMADGDLADFEGVHASLTVSLDRVERVFRELGFTIEYPKRTAPQRIHDFLDNVLVGGLMWAFHPYGARKGKRVPRRTELWISRSDFLRIYGRAIYASSDRTA